MGDDPLLLPENDPDALHACFMPRPQAASSRTDWMGTNV